jgi:prefoldin subunit 5
MSIESKSENLKKSIGAITDKIEKLELQKKLYQLTLEKLEKTAKEVSAEVQEKQASQE